MTQMPLGTGHNQPVIEQAKDRVTHNPALRNLRSPFLPFGAVIPAVTTPRASRAQRRPAARVLDEPMPALGALKNRHNPRMPPRQQAAKKFRRC
jgi:hypothetical protein